jgi:predicted metal-dependent hydrolase
MQFEYEVKYSKRKTLNITVERDRKIIVRAPEHTSLQKIEEVLQSKSQWLKEKINHIQKYPVEYRPKEFV